MSLVPKYDLRIHLSSGENETKIIWWLCNGSRMWKMSQSLELQRQNCKYLFSMFWPLVQEAVSASLSWMCCKDHDGPRMTIFLYIKLYMIRIYYFSIHLLIIHLKLFKSVSFIFLCTNCRIRWSSERVLYLKFCTPEVGWNEILGHMDLQ